MGLYDREYYREERPGMSLLGDRSMVTNLIIVNVGVYLLDLLLDGQIRQNCALQPDLFHHPWNAWQLLTAGFIHDRGVMHIFVNMLVLYFFGRDVEGIYGRCGVLADLSEFDRAIEFGVGDLAIAPRPCRWPNAGRIGRRDGHCDAVRAALSQTADLYLGSISAAGMGHGNPVLGLGPNGIHRLA